MNDYKKVLARFKAASGPQKIVFVLSSPFWLVVVLGWFIQFALDTVVKIFTGDKK